MQLWRVDVGQAFGLEGLLEGDQGGGIAVGEEGFFDAREQGFGPLDEQVAASVAPDGKPLMVATWAFTG